MARRKTKDAQIRLQISLALLIPLILVAACLDDREVAVINDMEVDQQFKFSLNEVVYTGSEQTNEFGETADWIEVAVSSDTIWILSDSTLFISDDPDAPMKYAIPSIYVYPSSYILLWCDDRDTSSEALHTNFKLSSAGETIVLSMKTDSGLIELERYTYPADLQDGMSYGKLPDESGDWFMLETPTPGTENE